MAPHTDVGFDSVPGAGCVSVITGSGKGLIVRATVDHCAGAASAATSTFAGTEFTVAPVPALNVIVNETGLDPVTGMVAGLNETDTPVGNAEATMGIMEPVNPEAGVMLPWILTPCPRLTEAAEGSVKLKFAAAGVEMRATNDGPDPPPIAVNPGPSVIVPPD
jgi:hypothetical protein